jgi:glycogen synthase
MVDVCMVTKTWRSGAAWHAQMTAKAIAETGRTIIFIAPLAEPEFREPGHVNLTRVVIPRERVEEPSRMRRAIASAHRILASLGATLRQRLATRTFLFTIPEPLIFILPLFAILRLSGARVLFLVHDAEPHAFRFASRWERAAHGLSYRLASGLICLTPSIRQELVAKFGVPAAKVEVIPHGAFSLGVPTPAPGRGRFLVFGSLRRNKRVLEVIEGFKLARRAGLQVSLILAGEPLAEEGGYWEQCLAAAQEDADGFDIRPGFVADEDLPMIVAEVDAFVLAYEDFASQSGVGVLAGLAARPVLGTLAGGLEELYGRGLVGEVIDSPVTPEAVAAAIERFSQTPIATWSERAMAGAERLEQALSWSPIGERFGQVVDGAR